MREFISFLIFMVLFVGTMIAMICAGMYGVNTSACNHLHRLTGVETDVSWSTGCMVKYRGEWVDASVATNNKQDVTMKGGK